MGGPVAGHIQRAGFPMVVYDLRAEATRPFHERGADGRRLHRRAGRPQRRYHHRPADARATSRTGCLRNSPTALKPGNRSISISRPARRHLLRELEPLFRAKGALVLDAPVASGQPGAARGIHEVMVGGDQRNLRARRTGARRLRRSSYSCRAAGLGKHLQTRPSNDQQHDLPSHRRRTHPRRQSRRRHRSALGMRAPRHGRAHARAAHARCRRTFFATTSKPKRFRSSCCAKTSAWRPRWVASSTCPLPLANITEQKLIEAINRGWGDKSAYTVTFKLQEEAAQRRAPRRGVDPAQSGANIFQRIRRRIERVPKFQAAQFVQNVFPRFCRAIICCFLIPRLERFERFERLELPRGYYGQSRLQNISTATCTSSSPPISGSATSIQVQTARPVGTDRPCARPAARRPGRQSLGPARRPGAGNTAAARPYFSQESETL